METSHHFVQLNYLVRKGYQTAENRQTEAKFRKHNFKITGKSLLVSVTFHSSNDV